MWSLYYDCYILLLPHYLVQIAIPALILECKDQLCSVSLQVISTLNLAIYLNK